jgi:Tol biopolymer transport system component
MLLVGITDSSGKSAPADPLAAGVAGLSVLRADGSGLRRVLTDGNVVWSPDGRRIAFTGSQCPAAAPPEVSVCTANPDGRAIRRIAGVPFGSGPMTWLVRRR